MDSTNEAKNKNKSVIITPEYYREQWAKIHSLHVFDATRQVDVFFDILDSFNDGQCICGVDGYKIWSTLLNHTDESINIADDFDKNILDKQRFWNFFHDLVNIKLNKQPMLNW